MRRSRTKSDACSLPSSENTTLANLPDPQTATTALRKLRSSRQADANQLVNIAMSGQSGAAQGHPVFDDPMNYLYAYGQSILNAKCKTCSGSIFGKLDPAAKQGDLLALLMSIATGKTAATSIVRCSMCQKHACLACGASASIKESSVQATAVGSTAKSCCDQGRLFVIWTALCAFDYFHSTAANVPAVPPMKVGGGKDTNVTAAPSCSDGTGYSHDDYPGHRYRRKRPASTVRLTDPIEKVATAIFQILAASLPQENVKSSFDRGPPAIILPMLQSSALLPRVVECLTNDSLVDISKQTGLYMGLLNFLMALKAHHLTSPVLFRRQMVFDRHHQLLNMCLARCQPGQPDITGLYERSLYDRLNPYYRQAQMALKALQAGAQSVKKEEEEMMKLCERIVHVYDSLEQPLPLDVSFSQCMDSDIDPGVWHRENCIKDVPDESFEITYYFTKKSKEMTGRPGKGRQKALVAEISSMQESLPYGIFVRYAESRPDMLKAIITGPKDTPYENGLFEFDFLCPLDYPRSPPKAHFKTTGGGNAHFNPNLYRCGKVCLSLLGTWEGEPWQPGISTILQILVSLQAMVFCAEPWCNEPGRHNDTGSSVSFQYDKSIRILTANYAWLYWARQTPKELGIWADVVAHHFRSFGSEILATLDTWIPRNRASYQAKDHKGSAQSYQSMSDYFAEMDSEMGTEALEWLQEDEMKAAATLAKQFQAADSADAATSLSVAKQIASLKPKATVHNTLFPTHHIGTEKWASAKLKAKGKLLNTNPNPFHEVQSSIQASPSSSSSTIPKEPMATSIVQVVSAQDPSKYYFPDPSQSGVSGTKSTVGDFDTGSTPATDVKPGNLPAPPWSAQQPELPPIHKWFENTKLVAKPPTTNQQIKPCPTPIVFSKANTGNTLPPLILNPEHSIFGPGPVTYQQYPHGPMYTPPEESLLSATIAAKKKALLAHLKTSKPDPSPAFPAPPPSIAHVPALGQVITKSHPYSGAPTPAQSTKSLLQQSLEFGMNDYDLLNKLDGLVKGKVKPGWANDLDILYGPPIAGQNKPAGASASAPTSLSHYVPSTAAASISTTPVAAPSSPGWSSEESGSYISAMPHPKVKLLELVDVKPWLEVAIKRYTDTPSSPTSSGKERASPSCDDDANGKAKKRMKCGGDGGYQCPNASNL